MSRAERLARKYREHVLGPWGPTLSSGQRVVFVVYPPSLERTLRAQRDRFRNATEAEGREWRTLDATGWFAEWLNEDEYREEWFRAPEELASRLETDFADFAREKLEKALSESTGNGVVSLFGVAALYGFLRVSELIRAVEPMIPGRLLVFFPGSRDGTNYRLLDARDGWNYLAQAITLDDSREPDEECQTKND